MAKFDYSSGLSRVVKQKSYLPGRQTSMFGPRLHDSGIVTQANASYLPEFGEFVDIVGQNGKSLIVDVVSATTTKADLAFVVRDVVGAQTLGQGIVEGPKRNIPITLAVQTAGQKGKYVAILGGGTPAINGQVFVGLGTGTTVAGVVYTEAQGALGVDTVATDWVFASTRFAPLNDGTKYVVEIQYKG